MSTTLEKLVNQQVMKWDALRREPATQAKKEPIQRPMITVSRSFGARGAEIGRLAAERLGFHFYSQELVHEIAREAHVRVKVLESLDERNRNRIDAWLSEQFGGERLSRTEYMKNLAKVVLTLGRHGKGVIIGRGAHWILDPAHTLRVRAHGPLPQRITRIAEQERTSEHEARAKVLRIDAEREAFGRQYFNLSLDDYGHYDLLLNTGSIDINTCVDVVVAVFRSRFPTP